MSLTAEQVENVYGAAVESPNIICLELARDLDYDREATMRALEGLRKDICLDVLRLFGVDELMGGNDLDLAIAVIANKWPEAGYEAISEMLEESTRARVGADLIDLAITARHDLLRSERLYLEELSCPKEATRRAVFFANRWPDATYATIASELDMNPRTVRNALDGFQDLLNGKRTDKARIDAERRAWNKERSRKVLRYAAEHPLDSYMEITYATGIPYQKVCSALRHRAKERGERRVGADASANRRPQWIELDDVVRYVEALDRGEQASLPQTSRLL